MKTKMLQQHKTITVGAKRGYTFYPTYLFDVPPKTLKTDTLRKKLMISEIKRSETQTQFYERGMILMGHLRVPKPLPNGWHLRRHSCINFKKGR